MTIRVGINGFGRIGRNFYRAARAAGADIDVVAANDLGDPATMAHLLRYDSVHGVLPYAVDAVDGGISIDGDHLALMSERDPAALPWGDLGVDVVIEATGVFKTRDAAAAHLDGGASKVIISAPGKGVDKTFVYGVNDGEYDPAAHHVVSNASCTTNCLVPMVHVLEEAFGVEKGLMTTIHAYTGTQPIVDAPHKDLRRARAGAINLIPTSTGAATATAVVLESMEGKLDGMAVRVPVPAGSLTDLTVVAGRDTTAEEVNEAFRAASESAGVGRVLDYTEEPIVSSDIVTNPASCTLDAGFTQVLGNLVKIGGWYDNEWGYSTRLVDLTVLVGGGAA